MKRSLLLPLLLVPSMGGCATHAVELEPEARRIPRGIYRYSGTVGGNSLGGIIELGYMLTVTTQKTGVCRSRVPVSRMYLEQNRAGRLTITCGETVVLQWDDSGEILPYAEVRAPIVEERTEQGTCLRWGTTRRGETRCVEWDQSPITTTRWVTGVASVSRDN